MIIKRICLRDNHILEIPVQSVTPEKSNEFRPFGVLSDIMPIACNLHSEIARTAMNGKPSLSCLGIFAILNEVVASSERAETFVEDAFLQFYTPAKVCDKTCINTRLIDQLRSS